uniref:Uncharacterized protein n=1 Tax=Strigops habroptila TaxID=2489341 RepID=A0A672TWE0_STRHB
SLLPISCEHEKNRRQILHLTMGSQGSCFSERLRTGSGGSPQQDINTKEQFVVWEQERARCPTFPVLPGTLLSLLSSLSTAPGGFLKGRTTCLPLHLFFGVFPCLQSKAALHHMQFPPLNAGAAQERLGLGHGRRQRRAVKKWRHRGRREVRAPDA